ncbi:glycine-rich protein [Pumilibacter intestinalis]|uniref:glycine-rich protein n=1 Tax=Pumilibacter intestinalis TaxID=2941511 RepID=UPI00203EAFDB|nr:glycine-rich protein [Pumilibacter intestinalis]
MVEKAKKRLTPILLAIMIAALLAVSVAGIISFAPLKAEAVTYDKYEFNYTGGVQSKTLKKGTWKFELWGAQGGSGTPYNTSIAGGKGGYVTGTWTFTSDTTVYIAVGGQGATKAAGSYSSRNNDADRALGGWNGGGASGANGDGAQKGGGGGATHVATTNRGVLSAYRSYQADVLIVAGGGGAMGGYSTNNAANARPGVGGGTTGGQGAGGNNYSGKGGTQSAGGLGASGWSTTVQPGSFGQGGGGCLQQAQYANGWHPSAAGGGGGGGWYGGGGGGDYGGGGGGGSSYTKSGMKNVSHTQGSRAGNGFCRITRVNSAPTQSSVPTFNIERDADYKFNINSASGTANGAKGHLNVTELDPNESGRIRTTGIYMAANTATKADVITGNNYWLTYTANANTDQITVRAKRWWPSTKRFYINIRDFNSSTNEYLASDVWIAVDFKCVNGGISDTGKTIYTADAPMKYGLSTSGATAQNASNAGVLYNPLGTGRRTVWLRDPVAANPVNISVSQLFSQTQGNDPHYLTTEAMVLSSNITYGTKRYDKDSGAAQTVPGGDSSAYTTVNKGGAITVTQYNGSAVSNITGGYGNITLQIKQGTAAGPYYYVMTVTVQLLDRKSAAMITQQTVDIVYRLDNTRPVIANPTLFTLNHGQTTQIGINQICTDPDNNTLTISDVVIPDHEYVLVNQYGTRMSGSLAPYPDLEKYYNVGAKASYSLTDTADLKVINETAQDTSRTTGFAHNFIYKTTGSGADNSFASSQTQGSSDTAYVGYYVNSARNTISLVGNKASRDMYASGRAANGKSNLGHFYILVRITDSGNPNDLGIWYPIAVKVNSAAPVAAGSPSVSGNAGDEFYLTPLGVQEANGNYFGIGTYQGKNENLAQVGLNALEKNGNKNVIPFAFDADNYANDSKSGEIKGTTGIPTGPFNTVSASPATHSQRETVFMVPNKDTLGNKSSNFILFNENKYDTQNSDNVDIENGFKEFYTVERVPLYAKASILLDLPKEEIDYLLQEKIISFSGNNASALVMFDGIKVTLKKWTAGQYVSFNVRVRDSHGSESDVRVAVKVNSKTISTANARSDSDETKKNYDTRGEISISKVKYPVTNREVDPTSGSVAFNVRLYVGESIAITPYDLFYDTDTFAVNNGKITNIDPQFYNTAIGSAGHAEMMRGINKKIAVNAGTTPDSAALDEVSLKKLTVSNKTPQIFGGDIYISREYVDENTTAGKEASEHFVITATRKTPSNGYVSFNYTITTSDGGSATAEIRVFVLNSLPNIREELFGNYQEFDDKGDVTYDGGYKMPFRLTASTDIEAVNSSMTGLGESTKLDTFGTRYFEVNDTTYNIREFTLEDLFYDPDGDAIQFYSVSSGIEVGIHDESGDFLPFDNPAYGNVPNVYVRATIGAGTNSRAGNSNCLILQGLSSTQGIPGGVWIRFEIIDNAVGSTVSKSVEFQVEVFNSTPKYADMTTATNAMENLETNPDNEPRYSWMEETDTTQVHAANVFEKSLTLYTQDKNGQRVELAQNAAVNKPMYIVSSLDAMDYYVNAVRKVNGFSTFTYSPSQVRVIANDVDAGQGLALWGAAYDGDAAIAPGFNVKNDFKNGVQLLDEDRTRNAAVFVTPIYDNQGLTEFYDANNYVQIEFFTEAGVRIDKNTDAQAANNATNWVIAFNFIDTLPNTFDVRIRLRDANVAVKLPKENAVAGNDTTYNKGTTGGFSNLGGDRVDGFGNNPNNLYEGVRVLTDVGGKKVYAPNTFNTGLHNNDGFFGVSIGKRPKGLYNNFTKWANTNESKNNVWGFENKEFSQVDPDAFAAANSESFKYDGILVPTNENGVGVPLSYFAWPQDIVSSSMRTGQSVFAWYNIGKFPIADDGDGGGIAARPTDEFAAITLSDGYNTWSGANLNKNPYVTFSTIFNETDIKNSDTYGDSTKKHVTNNYLFGQQRFALSDSNADKWESLPVIDDDHDGSYFFEDRYGLKITKASVRSVGNLTLTINISLWRYNNKNYVNETDKAISVTVPLTVANSALTLTGDNQVSANTYRIEPTSAQQGAKGVLLTTNSKLDGTALTGTTMIVGDPTLDQHDGTNLYNPANVTYREDMYFLSSSMSGHYSNQIPQIAGFNNITQQKPMENRFTAEQLDYIKKRAAADADLRNKLAKYLGIEQSDAARIQDLGISGDKLVFFQTGTKNPDTSLEVKINPYYINYFTVSPSGMDSQRISISPVRMTTFDYAAKGSNESVADFKARVEAQAKERNLKVDFDNDGNVLRIYYPYQVIIYDRMTVGYAANTTDFTESSFDVVTIEVEIKNSAPKLSSLYDIKYGGSQENNAREISLVKGRSVSYDFTDIFVDSDMIPVARDDGSGTYVYMNKADVEANDSPIVVDTGDYLRQLVDGDGTLLETKDGDPLLVGIKFMGITGVTAGGGANQYDDKNPNGAIECVATGTGIKITVKNRAAAVEAVTGIAARIQLTFTDKYGATVVCYIGVRITNAAPTLSSNATNVRNITMRTGQYFTLYTTTYEEFLEGRGVSQTVKTPPTGGNVTASCGTYYTTLKDSTDDSASHNLHGSYQPWRFYDYRDDGAGVYLPNNKIGDATDKFTPESAYPNNMGYMAIAKDDAPWTLRIGGYTINAPGVSNINDVIMAQPLNIVPYEEEPDGQGAATAIMFTAVGAVQNATISVTVLDGVNKAGAPTLSVTYTFNITVESTKPEAITAASEANPSSVKLGSALATSNPEMRGRLDHVRAEQQGSTAGYTYSLRLNVGEKVTLRTRDFANDIDKGDNAILPLLPRSGTNPFKITDSDFKQGEIITSSRYVSLTYSNGGSTVTNSSVMFTVSADNYHNGKGDDKLYSEIEFYIGDPYYADINHAVLIKLRVYVYPSGVEKVANSKDINVTGVSLSKGRQTVKLVTSTAAEGGLFTDKDAAASNTMYSVKVYTLTHYKVDDNNSFVYDGDENKIIESYSMSDFRADDNLLVAEYKISETEDSNNNWSFTKTTTAFDSRYIHSDIIQNYLSSIEFSEDGKEMYLTPNRATNDIRQVVGDSNRNGFRLCIAVEKYVSRDGATVGFTPDGSQPPAYNANVFAAVSVLNSSPKAVGNTDKNVGKHIAGNDATASTADNYRAYLSVEGKRHNEWIYPIYNSISEFDEALFVDPDGDVLSYVDQKLVRVYTYEYYTEDGETKSRQVNVESADVKAAAAAAYTVKSENYRYNIYGADGTTVSNSALLPAIRLAIQNKVVVPGAEDRTVYLEIEVSAKDAYSNERATTTLTLGIQNSTPVFKSEEDIKSIYNDNSKGTSYTKGEFSTDAELTLTLNLDNDNNRFISRNGEVTIAIDDLIDDADYDGITSAERFEFIDAGVSNTADMSMINKKSASTLWLHNTQFGVTGDSSTVKDKDFHVSVFNDNNTAIVFKVNTYNRGGTATLVLKVRDSAGATTGTLTIKLVVGNSAPIDLIKTGEANGRIILAGGTKGDLNDGKAFTPTQFNIRDFVRDNNPDDNRAHSDDETSGDGAQFNGTYLRITNYAIADVQLDPGSVPIEPDVDDGSTVEQEQQLVNFVTSFGQSFTIAPIPGQYGKETIRLTVTDGGNVDRADSVSIIVEFRIQVTKDPNDLDVFEFEVYWKRSKAVTANDIFGDAGEGLTVKAVRAKGSQSAVEIYESKEDGVYMVKGNTKTGTTPIPAVATVVVGASAKEYTIDFNITVLDNLRPYFRTFGSSNNKYGEGIAYIEKGYLNDSGNWEVSVYDIFADNEGDELQLVSASSKKSTLIDVIADTMNNKFVFEFKSRGDTEITCTVKDAVDEYTYRFKIGNKDLPAPNFFIGIVARIQENPLIFIIIAAAVLLLLFILILIIAAVRKKKKMRAEIEALLVSEMELEEQMLKLAAGPSPTSYQAYGYLPPTPNVQQQPGLMLGSGQGGPDPNAAIGLNPGMQNSAQPGAGQTPPADGGFNDDDL